MNVLLLQKLFFYLLFHKIIFEASAGGQSQSNQINGCKQDLFTTAKELVDSVPKEISDSNLNADVIEGWHKKFAGILCCVNFDEIETKKFLDGKNQKNYFKEIQRNFCNELKDGNPMEKVMKKMEKNLVNFPKILEKIQQSIQKMVDEKEKLMQKNALITNKNKEQFQMLMAQLNAAIIIVSKLFIARRTNENLLQRRRAKRMSRNIQITSASTSQVNNNSNNNNNNSRRRKIACAFVGFSSFYSLFLIIPGIQIYNHQLNLIGIILMISAGVIYVIQFTLGFYYKCLDLLCNNNND